MTSCHCSIVIMAMQVERTGLHSQEAEYVRCQRFLVLNVILISNVVVIPLFPFDFSPFAYVLLCTLLHIL